MISAATGKPVRDKISPQMLRFVDAMMTCDSFEQAALRAGAPAASAAARGSEWMKRPAVAKAVADRMKALAKTQGIDENAVIQGLAREARGEGPDTTSSARIRAWELIGRNMQMFVEKVEVTHGFRAVLEMTPEQLDAEIQKHLKHYNVVSEQ